MWRPLLLCVSFSVLSAGSALSLHGEESAVPKLLATRPKASFIEVRQFRKDEDITRFNFILWTPKLTLGEVVDAAGGFKGRYDLVYFERVQPSLSPELRYHKNQFLQDLTAQRETFRPGDRVTISFIIKPW